MGQTQTVVGTTPAYELFDPEKTSPAEQRRIIEEWRRTERQQAEINKQVCAQICATKAIQERYGLDKCANATGFEALTCGFESGFFLIPSMFLHGATDTAESALENLLASPLVIGAAAIALIVVLK